MKIIVDTCKFMLVTPWHSQFGFLWVMKIMLDILYVSVTESVQVSVCRPNGNYDGH